MEIVKTVTDILDDISKMEQAIKEMPDDLKGYVKIAELEAKINYAKSLLR